MSSIWCAIYKLVTLKTVCLQVLPHSWHLWQSVHIYWSFTTKPNFDEWSTISRKYSMNVSSNFVCVFFSVHQYITHSWSFLLLETIMVKRVFLVYLFVISYPSLLFHLLNINMCCYHLKVKTNVRQFTFSEQINFVQDFWSICS